MNLLPDNVLSCLDSLCAEGCTVVRQSITELEQGNPPHSATALSHDERQLLLNELKSIMSVYDDKEEEQPKQAGGNQG